MALNELAELLKGIGQGTSITIDNKKGRDIVNVKRVNPNPNVEDMNYTGPLDGLSKLLAGGKSAGVGDTGVNLSELESQVPDTNIGGINPPTSERFLGVNSGNFNPITSSEIGAEVDTPIPAADIENYRKKTEMLSYFLASAGKGIDPKGVGGSLGKGVTDWIDASRRERAALELQNLRSEGVIKAAQTRKPDVINIGGRAEESALGKQRAAIQSPEYPEELRKKLRSDSTYRAKVRNKTQEYISSGIDPQAAKTRAEGESFIEAMDTDVRTIYKGQKVEMKLDGWYVDGELKVRNPYAK